MKKWGEVPGEREREGEKEMEGGEEGGNLKVLKNEERDKRNEN